LGHQARILSLVASSESTRRDTGGAFSATAVMLTT
jgi:hypothetical protein